MSLFAGIEQNEEIKDSGDVLGGGSKLLDSGLYNMTVEMAYVQPAASGAIGVVLELAGENGEKLRTTEYITSGTAKGGKNYYERDGVKHFLPGFTMINDLCLLITGQSLTELEAAIEEKVIPVYNFEAKAQVPTKVPVLIPLLKQPIAVGVLKVISNKSVKGPDGKYVDTNETRENNEINKFFHPETLKTVTEYRAEADEAVFAQQWKEKNEGQVIDRFKAVTGGGIAGAPSKPGASAPAAANTAARPSLFGAKK